MREFYPELSLPVPYETAMRTPAIAICVRNFASARAARRGGARR